MRLVAAFLVLLLLAPAARAQAEAPEYPIEFLTLLPGWMDDAEALATPEDREKPWWPEAESFLERAQAAQMEGRFRVATFHIETYRELVLGNRLIDAGRAVGNDAQAKALVLQRTSGVREDAERAWAQYREKLHAYDGQLRSLQTVEKALYSADLAISGALATTQFGPLAREFPQKDGFPEPYVFSLVRASHTALLNIEWADALLAKALEQEGLPPQLVEEAWANLTSAAIQFGREGQTPAFLEEFDEIARPVRQNEEAILSVALLIAEQRAQRANGMQTIFGDARTRGLDVVNDAARGMRRQLNNTTLETPRGLGLTGVFTADAIDRAQVTVEYLEAGTADLGTVLVAWAALEHQVFMTTALSSVSPVEPPAPTPTQRGTPGPGVVALVALAGALALAGRRRG